MIIQRLQYVGLLLVLLSVASILGACSGPDDSADQAERVGSVMLPLSTTGNLGAVYRLDGAKVRFTGPVTKTVASAVGDESLRVDLTPGVYSTQLLAGWQLLKVTDGGTEAVAATLVSQNPIGLTIEAGEVTDATFRFDVSGQLIPFGLGRANVDIDVHEGTAESAPIAYANDGYTDGATVGFQGGFVSGECAYATFDTAAADLPVRLDTVSLLFGGSPSAQDVEVSVVLGPPSGDVVAISIATLAGSNTMQQVSIPAVDVNTAQFSVGVCVTHSGLPGVARDTDGISPNHNFIFSGSSFLAAESLGLTGDFIIRASGTHAP